MKKTNTQKIKDIILLLSFLATCIYIIISIGKIVTTSAPDFPVYYYATLSFVRGENAYLDPSLPTMFIYPTVTSIFYLPFLMFSLDVSQAIFVVLSAFAVPIIVYLSLRLIYKFFSWRLFVVFTSLAFLSFPTKFTLGMGQVNLIALLLLLIGYYFYQKKEYIKSGMILALSFLAKPVLSFLLIFYILKKAWKSILILFLTLFILLAFSSLLYGYQMEKYYLQFVVPILLEANSGRDVYYNQGLLGFFSRSIEDISIGKILSMIISGVLLTITLYTIFRRKVDNNIMFGLILILLPLIHTLSWQHYFVFLIFPMILTAKLIWEKKKYKLFGLLGIAYLLISVNIKDPSHFEVFPSELILSHTFFGGILLYFLLLLLSNDHRDHQVNI